VVEKRRKSRVESHLLLGKVVQEHLTLLRFLAPVLDDDNRTIDDLTGISLAVDLTETSPLAELLFIGHLDEGDLMFGTESDDELDVGIFLAVLVEYTHMGLLAIERTRRLSQAASQAIVDQRNLQHTLQSIDDTHLTTRLPGGDFHLGLRLASCIRHFQDFPEEEREGWWVFGLGELEDKIRVGWRVRGAVEFGRGGAGERIGGRTEWNFGGIEASPVRISRDGFVGQRLERPGAKQRVVGRIVIDLRRMSPRTRPAMVEATMTLLLGRRMERPDLELRSLLGEGLAGVFLALFELLGLLLTAESDEYGGILEKSRTWRRWR